MARRLEASARRHRRHLVPGLPGRPSPGPRMGREPPRQPRTKPGGMTASSSSRTTRRMATTGPATRTPARSVNTFSGCGSTPGATSAAA